MRTLLITTQTEERDLLSYSLQLMGWEVFQAKDAQKIFESDYSFDVIIICAETDDRLEMVKNIRSVRQTPIYIICDTITVQTHCDYLDEGVDCVSQRPLSLRLFNRYARMLVRRGGTVPNTVLSILKADWIQLDPTSRTVTVEGSSPQRLTQLEFRLLYVLMTYREQVIPTDELVERVWGYDGDGNRDLVRGLVRRLRKKIEDPSGKPFFIRNVPGIGYIFSTES